MFLHCGDVLEYQQAPDALATDNMSDVCRLIAPYPDHSLVSNTDYTAFAVKSNMSTLGAQAVAQDQSTAMGSS